MPPRLGPHVAHRHTVPEADEVGSCQPRSARCPPRDAAAGRGGRWVEGPAVLDGLVPEEPFDPVDRDGAVELDAVAGGFARVVAHPPVDGGERVVEGQLAPRGLRVPTLDEGEPRLDAGQPALLQRGHGGIQHAR